MANCSSQIIQKLLEDAKQRQRHIVLCEGADQRIQEAAFKAASEGIANISIIGHDIKNIPEHSALNIIDPRTSSQASQFAQELFNLRSHKGMTLEQANEAILDPLIFAQLMVKTGQADGSVAGAVYTTADVVRSAIQIIGSQAGTKTISSFFLMLRQTPFPNGSNALILADCALVIEPNADQLAEIAISSARSAQSLLGTKPTVAMLSFSTAGSAKHPDVTKVQNATKLAQQLAPELEIDGEMQLDTAIVPSIAQRKYKNSKIAGNANVLIFPNLAAGNIAYKICERIGGATAVGPFLQGLNRPANDLSRGCNTDDIFYAIAITSLQAN